MNIAIRRTEDWEWVWVYVNGTLVHEGHSVPDHVYQTLLQRAGANVAYEEVPADTYD